MDTPFRVIEYKIPEEDEIKEEAYNLIKESKHFIVIEWADGNPVYHWFNMSVYQVAAALEVTKLHLLNKHLCD